MFCFRYSSVIRGNQEAPPPISTSFTTSAPPTLPTTATYSAQGSTSPSDSTTTENRNNVFKIKQCKAVGAVVSEILSTALPQSPVIMSNGAAVPCPSIAVLPSQIDHESSTVTVAELEGQSLQQQKSESNIEKEQSESKVPSLLEHVSPTSMMPVNNAGGEEDSVAPVEVCLRCILSGKCVLLMIVLGTLLLTVEYRSSYRHSPVQSNRGTH